MKTNSVFTDNTGQQIIRDVEPDSYFEVFLHSIKDFFSWWYVEMPVRYLRTWNRIMAVLNDQLSITLILSNFFLPWRRHNSFAGYFFGISIKIIYLPFAVCAFILASTLYLAFIIFWILIPVGIIIAIIKTINS